MGRKYDLLMNDVIVVNMHKGISFENYKLHRIIALRDFGDVKKGDLGGYIEKEDNLSHDGDCWVYDNAKVYGNAQVYGNARVYYNAKVYGNAQVYGNARVYYNAQIFGDARVYDKNDISTNIGKDACIKNDNDDYYNAKYCSEDGTLFSMTMYSQIDGTTMVSIPGLCNCSMSKFVADRKSINSTSGPMFRDVIGDTEVLIYQDDDCKTKIKIGNMYNGDIGVIKYQLFIALNSVYGINPERLKKVDHMYKLKGIIDRANKYFNETR